MMMPIPARTALIVALLGASADQAHSQGRPFAPKARPPADAAANDNLLQMEIRSLEAATVPMRHLVEAVPYPGALVVQTIAAAERVSGEERYESLPVIVLFSSDPPDRVVDYYMENLAGWSHRVFLSSDYFWMGEEEFSPLDISGDVMASVQIRDARTSRLVPDAQTEIRISYYP